MCIRDRGGEGLDAADPVAGDGVELDWADQADHPVGIFDQAAFQAHLVGVGNGHAVLRVDGVNAHKAQVRVVEVRLGRGHLPHAHQGFLQEASAE